MRSWLSLMEVWAKTGEPFETSKERLLKCVEIEMSMYTEGHELNQLRRAFREFLKVWNDVALREKISKWTNLENKDES